MSKKIQPTSVDSTGLSTSVASTVKDEDSPYLKVCASVSNINDPGVPALSFRMWVIGLVLCMIGSGFFNFHQPAPQAIRPYSYSSRIPSENSRRIRCR